MGIEQVKVSEIVQRAVAGRVDIPEFQREFAWGPDQVKLLSESLYRDYPIGSLLLWDSSTYMEPKTAAGDKQTEWIVDGQQRITALCLLMGRKPYWWTDSVKWNELLDRYDVMVNIFPLENNDEEYLEFAIKNPVREKNPNWLSIRKILSIEDQKILTNLSIEAARNIENTLKVSFDKALTEVSTNLSKIWKIRDRQIPIIKIQHEVEDVAEIFARLNQAGTRVKEADVVLALVAVKNPGWVRKEYLPFKEELEDEGWDIDAGIFIRSMTGIGLGRARLKEVQSSFWNQENLTKIWDETKRTISHVIKKLSNFGLTHVNLLPSTNSLIPLFTLHAVWKDNSSYSFEKAFRWFLLANRDGRYSGSAITTLNDDIKTIKESSSFEEVLEKLYDKLKAEEKIREEEFLHRYDRAGSKFLRLLLYLLLFKNQARDWFEGNLIGYDKTTSAVTAGFEPHWHHIFPKSFLRMFNVNSDDINALANITVLNAQTNAKKIRNKPPWQYFNDLKVSGEDLKRHLIPDSLTSLLDNTSWNVDKYQIFITERAILLAEEANKFLDSIK